MLRPNAFSTMNDHYDSLQKAADDPDKVHFIVQVDRLGSRLFCVKLEYEHFKPRSGRNKLYDFHIINWPYDSKGKPIMMWFVVGIPKGDFALAERVAAETGMKIVTDIPLMVYEDKQKVFPMSGDRVYSIGTNPESVIYGNDASVIENRKRQEEAECDKIIKHDERLMREEFTSKGYGDGQIDRILYRWTHDDPNYMEKPEREIPDGQNRMRKPDGN